MADGLDLEERAANLITDSLQPRLLPDFEVISFRGRQLLAVRVYPSASRPHFVRRSGLRSGTYVRVGSTNRQADAQLIAEMQRFAIGETFDDWPMPAVKSEAVDFRAASESFAPVRKLTRRHLLKAGRGRGTREIAEAIGLSTRSTRTRLARLVERGLVREVGTGPHDPRRRYLIALDR